MSVPRTLEPDCPSRSPRLVLETAFHDSAGHSFDVSAGGRSCPIDRSVMSLKDDSIVLPVTDWFVEPGRATR